MIVIFYLMFCTSTYTAQSVENSTNATVIFNNRKGWSVSVKYRTEKSLTFHFSCKSCSLISDWAGLYIYLKFNQNLFNQGYISPYLPSSYILPENWDRKDFYIEVRADTLSIFGSYRLKDNKNIFKTRHAFAFDLPVIFSTTVPEMTKVIVGFMVNDELIFGYHKYKTDDSCCSWISKLADIRRDCKSFTEIINHKKPAFEVTIMLKRMPIFFEGYISTLIVQDDLQEIKTSDFKVVKNDDNQWTITDYRFNGNYFGSNLTLVADHHLRHPVPLSIIVNGKVLCGLFHKSNFDSFLTNGNEKELSEDIKTFHQIRIMLYIILTFIVLFGIHAIVTTYQMIDWRRHYHEKILDIWNKI